MNDVLLPQVSNNCRFCSFNQWMPAGVRVLNAAVNYNPFSVNIGGTNVAANLDQGNITRYVQVNQGFRARSLSPVPTDIFICKSRFISEMA